MLLTIYLFTFAVPVTNVFAAVIGSTAKPSNVTITVVLPDKAETSAHESEMTAHEPETAPAPETPASELKTAPVPETSASEPKTTVVPETPALKPKTASILETVPDPVTEYKTVLYPVDVTETHANGGRQIVKTYELSALDNPADIPRGDFERKGASGDKWLFTLIDIIKRETANAETIPHTETVTLNTDTKELEQILTMLAPTMEFKTDDEYAGILALDVASIKVESTGTKTTSYTKTVTREFPRLSSADTSLLPKTVEENGKTYTLADVDWKAGNYETVDYNQVPEYYTAFANYTATGTSTKVTGYITTAEYNGTIAKLSQGKTVYTAYFEGEEIRTPLEFVAQPISFPVSGIANEKETVAEKSILNPAEFSGSTEVVGSFEESVAIQTSEPAPTAAFSPTAEPALAAVTSQTTEPAKNGIPVSAEKPQPAEVTTTETTTTEATTTKPTTESGGTDTALYVIIAILALMLTGAAAYIIIRRNPYNEKTDNLNDPVTDIDADYDGGDAGAVR
jgi:hypothetical protein